MHDKGRQNIKLCAVKGFHLNPEALLLVIISPQASMPYMSQQLQVYAVGSRVGILVAIVYRDYDERHSCPSSNLLQPEQVLTGRRII